MGNIPQEQRAAVRQGAGGEATAPVKSIAVPQEPGPGQILVKINWTGLCASDKSLIHDEWAGFGIKMMDQTNGIAGHEGAGEVVAVAPDVADIWKVGDRAGVKWVVSICRNCEFCTNGTDELHCPKQLNSGFTAPGTFQEYCLTDGRYATRIPQGVLDEEAGPIMCGGVTAYTACKRSAVKPGQWLVVLGAGGGLGHFGVQYGRAMGMRVIAIDGGEEKGKLCKDLGAEEYIDFTRAEDIPAAVLKLTTYGAHGAIVFAAAAASYKVAPELLRPGGTVVAVGLPVDTSVICGAPPLALALKRLNIVGSVTGTLKDVEEALDFCARDLVHPILTKGSLDDVDKFCKLMKEGKLPGRAVLKVAA
ncbi:hypothetical protein DOTSEDRAFT_133358 [Dothistroma septosporum NZE10]|uniref:alcohol dehydrogenase n=1 Tax=Dothistroma septosporum (strain NZE10 / CBS 128990) TaxID=675120 RepID=N1PIQ5_DOTSN|nr:hypothetical protein DOTSEDRAFT_133358 [Dothistroma septosporum NZE10]